MFRRLSKIFVLGLILGFFCFGLSSCAWWQQSKQSEEALTKKGTQAATSIQKLLESVQYLAAAKDYTALQQHIYPYELLGMNVQAAMIYGIQKELKSDDFAYSEAALQVLINQHLSLFQPASTEQREEIIGEFFRDDKFQFWRQKQDPQFFIFEYEPDNAPDGYYTVTIVLIQEQGVYRLVFWENLDCLIRCENPRE